MQKKFFRKSTIESGGQAVESWSIWGQKKYFSQIDWIVIKTILNSQKVGGFQIRPLIGS